MNQKRNRGQAFGVAVLAAACAVEACSDDTKSSPSTTAGSAGAVGSSGRAQGGSFASSGGPTGGSEHSAAGETSPGGAEPAAHGGVGGADSAGSAGEAGAPTDGGSGGGAGAACDEQGAPPDWTLDAAANVDDPRWQEAGGVLFPDLTAGGVLAARSRLLDDQGTLFLQLRILKDVTPGNTASGNYRDSVYVAFADAALATISVVRIAIDNTGATHAARFTKASGTWTSGPASAGAPAWLSAFTALVNPATSGAETVSWAVNVKVASAQAPGAKLWYEVSISPSGVAQTQMYAWPNRGSFVEPAPPDTGVSAATWGAQFDAIGVANWGDYGPSLGPRCAP